MSEVLGSTAWKARVASEFKRQSALVPEGFHHIGYLQFSGMSLSEHEKLSANGDLIMIEPGFWARRDIEE